MEYILEEGSNDGQREDILIGCRCGDRFLWRLLGKESFSGISEGNVETLGGNKKEERPLTHHGDIRGVVQW